MSVTPRINVDVITMRKISGWASLSERPNTKLKIDLLDDKGVVVMSKFADQYREDLEKANIGTGDGRYAFEFIGDFHNITDLRISMPTVIPIPNFEAFKIHPNDPVFWSLYELCRGYLDGAVKTVETYNDNGMYTATTLLSLVNDVLNIKKSNLSLLEFNAGFGCATRHIDKSRFKVTSCDIQKESAAFLSKTFGVNTLEISDNPENFNCQQKFDIVFALSSFAHFNKEQFKKWLSALYNVLSPHGYLIFTTHGETSNENIQLELKDGFAYKEKDFPEKLNFSDYGVSVATKSYVTMICKEVLKKEPILAAEAYWAKNQDLYVIRV